MDESKEMCTAWEGCLSNDDDLLLIERPMHIKVRFQALDGIKDKTLESKEPVYNDLYLRGLMARIFQHEIDHLNGILAWDLKIKDKMSTKNLETED